MYEDFTQERIAQLRMQKGSSARDMSLSLGQNVSYINKIENKKALPSMQGFFYICEYLGVTPQEFFDEGNTCPEQLRELLTEGQKLEPSVLRHVLEVIKDLNRKQEKRNGP